MNCFLIASLCLVLSAPSFAAVSSEDLKKALEANPNLLVETLKKSDKVALFELIMDAQREYQVKKQKEEEAQEAKDLEEALKNPLKPLIDSKTRIRGDKKAPITLVEYSDAQCPYCFKGYQVVESLREKYGAKIRFIYKHLPLVAIHPMAMPAAKWMEAVALQSPEKGWLFHDKLFQNQSQLSEDFFKKTAKELGVNVDKAAQDAESPAVAQKIENDINEAKSFKFSGTPGFLINGVPLRGAYPIEKFDEIIIRLGIKP